MLGRMFGHEFHALLIFQKFLIADDFAALFGSGSHGGCLGDTMYGPIRVADLGGRILKWAKTDEKLIRKFGGSFGQNVNFGGFVGRKWISHF